MADFHSSGAGGRVVYGHLGDAPGVLLGPAQVNDGTMNLCRGTPVSRWPLWLRIEQGVFRRRETVIRPALRARASTCDASREWDRGLSAIRRLCRIRSGAEGRPQAARINAPEGALKRPDKRPEGALKIR